MELVRLFITTFSGLMVSLNSPTSSLVFSLVRYSMPLVPMDTAVSVLGSIREAESKAPTL